MPFSTPSTARDRRCSGVVEPARPLPGRPTDALYRFQPRKPCTRGQHHDRHPVAGGFGTPPSGER